MRGSTGNFQFPRSRQTSPPNTPGAQLPRRRKWLFVSPWLREAIVSPNQTTESKEFKVIDLYESQPFAHTMSPVRHISTYACNDSHSLALATPCTPA